LLEVYGKQKTDIYVKPFDPAAEATPFLEGPADERHARFSPDGRWVAYSSDETGDYEVFVRPFPGTGGRWQISNAGLDPYWSSDGRSIHYRANRAWWVVDVDPGDVKDAPFRTGAPRLVRRDLPRASLQWTFGMSHQSDAFLVAVSEGDEIASPEIRVVVNWLDELERLVP
jgi:Tol biopolymer transport system component